MSDNIFEENNKFLSTQGIIGRRGFIINLLIIEIIEGLLWTTPVVWLILTNPKFAMDFAMIKQSIPLWYSVWLLCLSLISSTLYFPNIVRRVRDILGTDEDNRCFMISAILTLVIFIGYTPLSMGIGKWCSTFVLLYLMIVKGKITSQKPKSEVIKFNWGALCGSWMWGIFNKTPITLLAIPLSLTFSAFPFALICGLKGNEWALENRKYETVEKMHNSQSNQTIFWILVGPIIYTVFFVLLSIMLGTTFYKYSTAHPEFKTKIENVSKQYQEISIKANFNKVELGEKENKFYIDPQIWSGLNDSYRKQLFMGAARYADAQTKDSNKKYSFMVIEAMNKTKIYSTFNDEVLAEFHVDTDEYAKLLKSEDKNLFKQVMKLQNSGYKFNTTPSLP